VLRQDTAEHDDKVCERSCERCSKVLTREKLRSHDPDCSHLKVACEFDPVGCQNWPLRKDIGQHNDATLIGHASCLLKFVQGQRQKIEALESAVRVMQGGKP
jgi:hypothetical protein